MLSKDEVRWVAHLARLECTPDEIALFTPQLNQIVEHVEKLAGVPTEGVEPLSHPLPIKNVFREDVVTPGLTADQALANAPRRKDNFYSVPAVLD